MSLNIGRSGASRLENGVVAIHDRLSASWLEVFCAFCQRDNSDCLHFRRKWGGLHPITSTIFTGLETKSTLIFRKNKRQRRFDDPTEEAHNG